MNNPKYARGLISVESIILYIKIKYTSKYCHDLSMTIKQKYTYKFNTKHLHVFVSQYLLKNIKIDLWKKYIINIQWHVKLDQPIMQTTNIRIFYFCSQFVILGIYVILTRLYKYSLTDSCLISHFYLQTLIFLKKEIKTDD